MKPQFVPDAAASAPTPAAQAAGAASAAAVRRDLEGKHVCPFCGVMRADANQPCPRCTLDDTNATRTATKQRIGPWFVLQARNPSAPGMKLATLQSLVRRGHVTARSVVRGPTTDQMWCFAAGVRGLAREFGVCYHCGEGVATDSTRCPNCGRGQEPPADTDSLLLDTAAAASIAPLPPPPALPVPPPDFLADKPTIFSDSGMDGGTSLDLQADPMFPVTPPKPAAAPRAATPAPAFAPANAPSPANARQIVQRAAQPTKDDAILSASELAAAFQLDFKPGAGRSSGVTPAGLPRERRPVRTFAALLLILAVAGGIVLALRPDWRDTSLAWANDRWHRLAASLERPAKATPSPNPTPPNAALPDGPPPAVRVNDTPPAGPTPDPTPTPVPRPTPPEPVRDATPPGPPVPTPTPPEARPTPPVAVVTPRPAAGVTPIPPNLSIEQATALAGQIRLSAIDAQTRGDWKLALAEYEQIRKLPDDAWPADLGVRIDVARRRAGAN